MAVEEDIPYDMNLSYYITSTKVSEEYCDLKVYGVQINKEAHYPGGEREIEKKRIGDLFFNKEECSEFVSRLLDNEVTPMGLKYAIREYIGEKIHVLDAFFMEKILTFVIRNSKNV